MSRPFPEDAFLKGNYAPVLSESDAYDLPVMGEMPRELRGALYRNGPNPQFAPRDRYHWFTGDGMIHGFFIADGRVRYRNRWVRTPKWRMEHQAGQALFGTFGNPMTSDPSAVGKDGGVANTNIVWHAGRLLALEEAHPPTELDPDTLETRGYHTFGGKLQGPMTAHPKIDPETGEMVFFGYAADGRFSPTVSYQVVNGAGELVRSDRFTAPYASMVHDFAVTRNHVIFPILPLTGSMERAMSGKPAYAWEPDKGSHIGILRRGDPIERMRWFTGDPCYVFHPMNAWEEGERVFADVMEYAAAPLFPRPDGTPVAGEPPVARLVRWTFDLAGNSDGFTRETLEDLPGEFPRFDERRAGLSYRHAYYVARQDGRQALSADTLVHVDLKTGRRARYSLPAGDALSEAVFVPRAADSPEGDGFLLATVYRGEERRSDLCVFDAGAVEAGPVASAQLTQRVPFGFHGNWRPAH